MEMVKFDQRDDTIINQLMDIWENSVRATHLFLKEEDILRITEYVPQELTQIPVLIAAKKDGRIVGFMGIDQDSLEMLFILDKERGQAVSCRRHRHHQHRRFAKSSEPAASRRNRTVHPENKYRMSA